jgi:hypothetical protein
MKKDLVEEARQIRLAAEALEKKVKLVRGAKQVVKPHSVFYVGDEGPTDALMESVRALLKERPRTFRELLEETGARDNRIKGVIMRLQRDGEHVINLGNETKASWFIPDTVVLERLLKAKRAMVRK